MTKRRKKEILKSLFNDFPDKPISLMDVYEKLSYLSCNMTFQLGYRKRVITNGKEFKEVIIDEDNPINWTTRNKITR